MDLKQIELALLDAGLVDGVHTIEINGVDWTASLSDTQNGCFDVLHPVTGVNKETGQVICVCGQTLYRYWGCSRPPFWDCVTSGFVRTHIISPAKSVQIWGRPTEWNQWMHGFVEYSNPLPFRSVWMGDLVPQDPAEWAEFYFWLRNDRDDQDAQADRDDYITAVESGQLGLSDLEQEGDLRLRIAVEILLQGKVEKEDKS